MTDESQPLEFGSQAERLAAEKAALESCETEPIQLIGTVQPIGWLIATEMSPEMVITHVSKSVETHTERTVEELLGQPLSTVLDSEVRHLIANVGSHRTITAQREYLGVETIDEVDFDLSMHQADDRWIIELVPAHAQSEAAEALGAAQRIIGATSQLQSVDAVLERTVAELRALTGYDRVKAYRFLPDGAGEVVAESRRPDVDSFLGLRFPAFDIPQAARTLYAATPIRVISDVDIEQSPIAASVGAGTDLDLSLSVLRGTSEVHMMYLRNMGVSATMSLPIVVDGIMWGLFAFHHHEPIAPSNPLSMACELIGRSTSLQIQYLLQRITAERIARCVDVVASLVVPDDSPLGFSSYWDAARVDLAALIDCDGVALAGQERVDTHGACPSEETIRAFTARLSELNPADPLGIEALEADHGDLDFGPAAGVLALARPLPLMEALLFFRKESGEEVRWAGPNEKAIEESDAGFRLNPRSSFAQYIVQSRGRCDHWTSDDIDVARSLQTAFSRIGTTLDAHQGHRERLGLVVRELNHRVRNILALVRSIVGQTRQFGSESTIEDFARSVERRITALANAHNMLTESDWESVDLESLTAETIRAYSDLGETQIRLEGPLVAISPTLAPVLSLVLHELTSNAAKYGALSVDAGQVDITWQRNDEGLTIDWHESGGPGVTPNPTEGFGSSIIRNALPFEFNAQCTVDWLPGGVAVKIVLPPAALHVDDAPDGSIDVRDSAATSDADVRSVVRSALVVEDDFVIASETSQALTRLGVSDVTVVPSVETALAAIAEQRFDFALLDVNLQGKFSGPIAEVLTEAGVRFAFATGYGSKDQILAEFDHAGIITKPISETRLSEVLGTGLDLRDLAAEPRSILILEDDVDLADQWRSGFANAGFDVHVAFAATEAMAICRQHHIDGALVDMFIRGPDGELANDGGLSLISMLRRPGIANTKIKSLGGEMVIIAISGSKPAMGFDVLELAAHEGATLSVRKPVATERLVAAMQSALDRAAASTSADSSGSA